jgi:ferredoxin
MEGPGPGNGIPFPLHLALGSTNLLAIDIVASRIIGYDPLQIETNLEGLNRRKWLSSIDDVIVQGVDIEQVVRTDFKRIPRVSTWKMSFNVVLKRITGFRRTEREPVFFKKRCTGCKACLNICPVQVLRIDPEKPHKVLIDRRNCIRCFCCHEVCPNNAIEIK